MHVDGEKTYWGQVLDGDLEQDIKPLPSKQLDLKKRGANAEEQDIKDKANEISEPLAWASMPGR